LQFIRIIHEIVHASRFLGGFTLSTFDGIGERLRPVDVISRYDRTGGAYPCETLGKQPASLGCLWPVSGVPHQ
jgi:hypothetical protein